MASLITLGQIVQSEIGCETTPRQLSCLMVLRFLLPSGLSALVLDTDVVLLSDPFLHLGNDADLEVAGRGFMRCV